MLLRFFSIIFLSLSLTLLPTKAQTTPAPLPATGSVADPAAIVAQAPPSTTPTPALSPLVRPAQTPPEEQIRLQFPHTSINEILLVYETLTGKRIIRDSKLAGDELSIVAQRPMPKSDAVRLIEAALLLNGYSLVPVDAQTSKILGQAKSPRAEGIPLIASPEDLPASDVVVSYYMPLRYLSAQDASAIFRQFVKLNPYGSIVPLASASAIVITEKTPLIRTMVELQRLIDKAPAQISRHFVILERANTEKVVEILNKMFGLKNDSPSSSAGGAVPPPSGDASGGEGGGNGAALLMAENAAAESLRFIADERTNRVIVVCKEELFPQIQSIIADLDASVDLEKPLEYSLRYARAAEVLPVLAKLIAESKEDVEQATNASGNQSGTTHQSQVENNNSSSYTGLGSGSQSGSGSGSDLLGGGTSLRDPDDAPAPQCVIVGKTRIIADSSANSIIIIGPPESRDKAQHILAILDRKPLQIYLSTLIGELRLENGMDYGFNYILKFNQLSGGGNGGLAGTLGGAAGAITGGDILPDPTKLISNTLLPALSGLTLYGTIAQSVDIFAHFLETTNRFKTLSRPVLYTTNNKKAVILSGQEVPVPTTTLTNTTPGLSNSEAITANIDYKPVVLKLEVIPLINSNNEVTLVISQQNNTIQGNTTVAGQTVPIINTQQITTTVTVPDGRTVVLGGLITEDNTNDKSGIPYISRIPLLGAFFGTTSKNKTRRELIVMIQPIIIDGNEALEKASSEEVARPNVGPEVYRKSQPVTPTPSPLPNPGPRGRKPTDD